MQCSFSIVIWISMESIVIQVNSHRIDDKTKDIIQPPTVTERIAAYVSDGVGDGHARQTTTVSVFASCFIYATCVLNDRKVMTQNL